MSTLTTLRPSASASTLSAALSPVLTPAGSGFRIDLGDHGGRIAISSEQSGGAFTLIAAEVAFQGGPPPHVHSREDEAFHILEGRFEFWIDGKTFHANPGDTVFAPRHIPHGWRCISPQGGRALGLVTPGENFERFFTTMGSLDIAGAPSPEKIAALCALAESHGLQMLPPAMLQNLKPAASATPFATAITAASAEPLAPQLAPQLAPVFTANGHGRAFDMGDHWGDIAISSEQSGGAFTLFAMEVAAQGGPPPHVHFHEDESFHIQEGRFEFWVDGATIQAGPGDIVFAPRHIPHTWRCVSEEGGRALVLITPGENFERFFLQLSAKGLLRTPTPDAIASLIALGERHGLEMVSPAS